MKLATSADIPMSEFWEMTPLELNIAVRHFREKQKQQYKEKIEIAYYNAMWTIQWLGKKEHHPKPLKEIIEGLYKEEKVMSDDEMLNQVKALNKLFGGEVIN